MKRDRYIGDEQIKQRRRALRDFLTKAEYVLWQELRREKLGYRFRRQTSIAKFIVDFYCHELHLIIEVDGPIHDVQGDYDGERDQWLNSKGYMILRLKNDDVLFNRDRVLFEIQTLCERLSQRQQ